MHYSAKTGISDQGAPDRESRQFTRFRELLAISTILKGSIVITNFNLSFYRFFSYTLAKQSLTMQTKLATHPPPTDLTEPLCAQTASNTRAESLLRRGCEAVAFLVPLKLSLAYIALIPLILFWAYHTRGKVFREKLPLKMCQILTPLLFFLLSVAISSIAGLSLSHSSSALLSLLFFGLTVPIFFSYATPRRVLPALLRGQSIAALHSVLDSSFPGSIPSLFLGKVTESGQLAITLLLALGSVMSLKGGHDDLLYDTHAGALPIHARSWRTFVVVGIVTILGLVLIGFRDPAHVPLPLFVTAFVMICAAVATAIRTARKLPARQALLGYLLAIHIPLMLAALLVNLKRGPWLGVLVGTSVLCFLLARKLLAVVLAASVMIACGLAPVRERLLESYDHFVISGGRSTIWRIGAELASEYPLGIGYHNSGILRKFAPEIPPELKHFHNNILNIAAENGWLTAALFGWFLFAVLRASFSNLRNPFHVAIGCAFVSWQVAGIVEYNFGDSEVMIIIWIVLGILLQAVYSQNSKSTLNERNSSHSIRHSEIAVPPT